MTIEQISASDNGPRFVPVSGSPLFAGLNAVETQAICALHAGGGRRERNALLVRAREAAAPLLTVLTGTAFRFTMLPDGGRQILSIFLPGDTIGLDTLLYAAPIYPVQCASAVTYATIDHDDAMQLAAEAGWFRRRAASALAHERAAAELAIIRLGQFTAEQRVASFLLEMYDRLSERGLAGAGEFTLELTEQHVADLLGLTAMDLRRELGRLKAQSLLVMNGQRVSLPDLRSLKFLAVSPGRPVFSLVAS